MDTVRRSLTFKAGRKKGVKSRQLTSNDASEKVAIKETAEMKDSGAVEVGVTRKSRPGKLSDALPPRKPADIAEFKRGWAAIEKDERSARARAASLRLK
jgi:hypothetical protein